MSSSSAPINPDRPHDDDSWEQLEAELFGIPYTKEHVPDDYSDAVLPSAPPADLPVLEKPLELAAPLSPAADPEAPSDEFGFSEPPPRTPTADTPKPAPTNPPTVDSGSDSYWNALENFDWTQPADSRPHGRGDRERGEGGRPHRGNRRRDESRGPRRESGGRDRGRRSDRPQRTPTPASESVQAPASWNRPVPTSPTTSQQPVGHDDFGQGLVDDEPTPVASNVESFVDDTDFILQEPPHTTELPAPPSATGPADLASESSSLEPQRDDHRRRRRRRRGRRGDRGEPASDVETTPSSGAQLAESRSTPADDWPSETDINESEVGVSATTPAEFGGASDELDRDTDSRRHRHRGDRDLEDRGDANRKQNSGPNEQLPVAEFGTDSTSDVPKFDGESEEDGEELDVSYGHVPSWEEAISYLLNPNLVEMTSSSPATGQAQSGDHGRPPRHRGHKRH